MLLNFNVTRLTCSQFERGTPAQTHTSQTSLTVQCSLPVEARAASDKYRSVNDPTNKAHKNFLLIDTPGHGKLRHFALDSINNPLHLKGIIFVVDAATLSEDSEGTRSLTENAQYLHDMLHILQTKHTSAKTSKGSSEIPVLVAANKLDLFTALPTKLVRKSLEAEITKLRNTKSKGLIDSGVGMNDDELDDPEVLGGNGEGKFEFKLMEEYNIPIEVAGGSVTSAEGPDTDAWWDWIARHL